MWYKKKYNIVIFVIEEGVDEGKIYFEIKWGNLVRVFIFYFFVILIYGNNDEIWKFNDCREGVLCCILK